jgi:hypothetical protein
MNDLTRAVLAMSLLVLAGCSEGAETEDPQAGQSPLTDQGDSATEEAASDLDGGFAEEKDSSIPAGTPFRVRGCTYVAFERVVLIPPPAFQVIVERIGSKHCESASVQLAMSFNPTNLLVATKGGKGIVVGYTVKPTPSGAGLSHVEIASLSPTTLATLRTAGIGSPNGSSDLTALFFQGNSLVAEGHRPEGDYIATFPRFLTSMLPPTIVIVP